MLNMVNEATFSLETLKMKQRFKIETILQIVSDDLTIHIDALNLSQRFKIRVDASETRANSSKPNFSQSNIYKSPNTNDYHQFRSHKSTQ
jgi:CO dehydrogenase/acetyl-CoA synthase delta subunit